MGSLPVRLLVLRRVCWQAIAHISSEGDDVGAWPRGSAGQVEEVRRLTPMVRMAGCWTASVESRAVVEAEKAVVAEQSRAGQSRVVGGRQGQIAQRKENGSSEAGADVDGPSSCATPFPRYRPTIGSLCSPPGPPFGPSD